MPVSLLSRCSSNNFNSVAFKLVVSVEQVGPRFEMRPYKIVAGTLDQLETARVEWTIRPYMNTSYKRRFLSTDATD